MKNKQTCEMSNKYKYKNLKTNKKIKTSSILKSQMLTISIITIITIIKILSPIESLGANEAADLEISTKEQLEAFRDSVNSGESYEGKTVKLTADINLNGSESSQWTPIGSGVNLFKGTFDGNNRSISGLYMNNVLNENQGLFSNNSGTIKNLIMKNVNIKDGSRYTGVIAGTNSNTIINCTVESGSITINTGYKYSGTEGKASVDVYAGAIAGVNYGSIEDCTNKINIVCNKLTRWEDNTLVDRVYIGGVTGEEGSNNVIKNCKNLGNIESDGVVGGIVGKANWAGFGTDNYSIISGCYNKGQITAKSSGSNVRSWYIGGIVGEAENTKILNCYNAGNIINQNKDKYIGGIAGENGVKGIIQNSYNSGNLTGESCIGGICSQNSASQIIDCYNTGDISGKADIGGIAVFNNVSSISNEDFGSEIIRCSNSGNLTGETAIGGIAAINGSQGAESTAKTEISECYNTGTITGNELLGGIAAQNRYVIKNSYNVGTINNTTEENIGSVVGYNGEDSKNDLNNVYYKEGTYKQDIGTNLSEGRVNITKKTESEMKTSDFVSSLNAEGTYFYLDTNNTNNGYPILEDKIAPILEIKYSETETTDQDVTVTITSNEELQPVSGWELASNKLTLTKTYQENIEETIEVSDLAGNKASVKISITNIFKNTKISFKEENMYKAIIKTLGEKVVDTNDNNFEITLKIKDLEETTQLDINDSQITDISGIENFTNLETLNIQNNNIEDISKLSTLTKLKMLNLNNNKLTNSSLKNIENLTELQQLGIANNNITEITSLTNLRNIYILNIGGNNIQNISSLSNLTKLTQIIAQENKINNIDSIKNLTELISINFSYNQISTLPDLSKLTKLLSKSLEGQELEVTVTGAKDETVTVELPDIIKKAAEEESTYYSENGIDVQNCNITEDKQSAEIEIYQAATNTGIIFVNSGELIGCNLKIYGTTVDYGQEIIENEENVFIPIETSNKVNIDITAQIISSNPNVQISETGKHLFQTNGKETLYYIDENNEQKELTATVNFIDKQAPNYNITYSKEEPTNQNVTVTITVDEEIQDIYEYENEEGEILRDWNLSEDKTELTKIYEENDTEIVLLIDEAGNEKEIEIVVDNIIKEKPEAGTLEMKQETAEGENYINNIWTNKDVYIKLIPSAKENTKSTYYINGEEQKSESQILTENGEYEIIVKTTDMVGNENQNEYKIKIDKDPPTVGKLVKKLNYNDGEELTEETTNQNVYIAVEEGTDKLSGHYSTTYKINEGEEQTQSQILTESGIYNITVITKDKAGNTIEEEYNLQIDKGTLEVKQNYETLSNNTVKVTIESNREIKEIDGWEISEDKKVLSKIYVENKTEEVTITDLLGNQKTITINVNTIDDENLIYTTDISNEEMTNQNVTVKIIANKELKPVEGWSQEGYNKILKKEYSQNTKETITISDLIGNSRQVEINITNIDKQKPEAEVIYSNQSPTNQNVKVTIKANEPIEKIEGFEQTSNKEELTKEYETNTTETIIIKDLVGNTNEININITNIDKQKPEAEVIYSNKSPTNQNVKVTIKANEPIEKIEGFEQTSNKNELTKEYEANTSETITITDIAGNKETKHIEITNIDKQKPILQINYSNTDKVAEQVTVTITANE